MSRPSVFATRRWPAASTAAMEEAFDVTWGGAEGEVAAGEIASAMRTHDAVALTVREPMDAAAIEAGAGGRCRIVSNFGVGVDHIDLAAAARHGLVVTNTPGVLTDATADLAVTLMLMAARRAGEGERELRRGEWTGWRPTHLMGLHLAGKTLGIVGMGRIGKATARRAALGFGMDIVFHNRSPVADCGPFEARQLPDAAAVCEAADIVSLHCPGGGGTRHIIGGSELDAIGPDGILVNTARGDVVDEDALADALEGARLGSAGLDVYQGEPEVNPRLLAAPNAVLLPHLGSATVETREAMGMMVVENLKAFFAGGDVPNPVRQ